MNRVERQRDILKIIQGLDISPTMYKNAVEKYTALATYLEENGFAVSIYPQGSFAYGTVVRPLKNGKDAAYDLDFVYQVNTAKKEISPEELRSDVEKILTAYDDNLVVDDRCFTIEYADIDDVGFSIDIVPATDESESEKKHLKSISDNPELIDSAIAIPEKDGDSYSWITSNPKGYKKWFIDINQPFSEYSRYEVRKALFESNQRIYCSIDEVPAELERSSLQRVIQILKYHRNVYYSHLPNGDELKPISAIIVTLVTKIAEKQAPSIGIFELLEVVLDQLVVYSRQLSENAAVFKKAYPDMTLFIRDEDGWLLQNPANPEDNLTDSWKDNELIAPTFFKWITIARESLIESLNMADSSFRVKIEQALGEGVVKKSWGNKYSSSPTIPITTHTQAKPWRKI